jgi:8-oxo-dGTP pyrophosphatase MutT (NUDIX family)
MSYCCNCGDYVIGSRSFCNYATCLGCFSKVKRPCIECKDIRIDLKQTPRNQHLPYRAGSILICDHHIVVVQNQRNQWGFPKGAAETNDVVQEAIRETLEETGVDIYHMNHDFIWSFTDHFYIIVNLPTCVKLDIIDYREIQKAKWVHIDNLSSMNLTKAIKYFIRNFYYSRNRHAKLNSRQIRLQKFKSKRQKSTKC